MAPGPPLSLSLSPLRNARLPPEHKRGGFFKTPNASFARLLITLITVPLPPRHRRPEDKEGQRLKHFYVQMFSNFGTDGVALSDEDEGSVGTLNSERMGDFDNLRSTTRARSTRGS